MTQLILPPYLQQHTAFKRVLAVNRIRRVIHFQVSLGSAINVALALWLSMAIWQSDDSGFRQMIKV
ncbi:hypothetical protein DYD82_13530 [Dickeya fangzhongdai]|nr:hypothetical protein DYD82_13530 [Dickeya fangzhongdai]